MSTITDNTTLKQLISQRDKLQGEIDGINIELIGRKKELQTKQNNLNSLNQNIKKLQNPNKPQISEHALLRYCERVLGIDMEAIKNEILSENVLKMIATLGGNGQYPNNHDGKPYQIAMKNNTVTTIK